MMASLLNFGDMRPGAGFLGLQQDVRGVPANRDNVFGRIGQVITDNPLTLMALGAGIARGGIGAGLQFAVPALEAEQEQRRRDQAQTKTYQGLRAAGTPFGEAMVGALHPEVLKAIARSRFVSTQ